MVTCLLDRLRVEGWASNWRTGELADAANHHPNLDLMPGGVAQTLG